MHSRKYVSPGDGNGFFGIIKLLIIIIKMAYLLNNSNLFAIQSAISEFKRVILSQNQVISSLQTALNTSLSRVDALELTTAANTTALNASLSRVDALETTTSSNTSAISGQASSIASNTTNITTVLDELAATNRTVTANTTNLSANMTALGNMQPVVAGHTASLATLQSQVAAHSSDLATKTTQISVLDSISSGHTTSIGNNYNEIFRLNGVSLNHAALLSGLRTDVDSGGGSQADIAALQSDLSTVNTTLAAHDVLITENRILFTGFGDGISSIVGRLGTLEADLSTVNTTLATNTVLITENRILFTGFGDGISSIVGRLGTLEADLSTINTTLTAHGGRLDSIEAVASGVASTISTIQSNATFHANALGVLTTRVNQQVDTILVLTNAVDTLGDQITSSGDIDALTSTVDGLATQVSTISTRSFTNMQQIGALQTIVSGHTTQINANKTLADALLNASQFNSGLISVIDGKIIALRTDTDANTLSCSQLLTASEYLATTIFAIDTAIQISNGKIATLETSQITQDNLIREFDQLFNEPANGVVDKLNNIISTYNTHISGVYLTLRQNVDSNNLILGTLSTHTTSLLTAMTQVTSRVQLLEDNASSSSSTPQFSSSTINVSGVSQSTLSAIGPGWTQIKYLSGTSNSWFPGNGNLNGNTGKTEFLFTSGDFSKWLICDISQAIGSFYSDSPRFITKSSISSVEYTATWYNRQSFAPEDPWISLEDHSVSGANGTIMFGENSVVGYQNSIHPSGMYVFVR